MAVSYTLDQYVNGLRAIAAKETDPVKITDLVAPLAKKFARSPGWFRPKYRDCDAEQGFGVHMLHEEPNHDLAIFLVSWLPNRGTTPHNHKTWAVVVGMDGEEKETSYDRIDDGATSGYADLTRGGEQVITAGDITRCYPEHIHSVWNVGKKRFNVTAHVWPAYQLHRPLRVRCGAQMREAIRAKGCCRRARADVVFR